MAQRRPPGFKHGRTFGSVAGALLATALLGCGGPASAPTQAVRTARADPAAGPVGPVTAPGGPFLEDRYGRVVLLHGADLAYKVAPYEVTVTGAGPNVLTTREVEAMAGLGFDVVRLGIIWKGLEPGHGAIDGASVCAPGMPRPSESSEFVPSTFDAYLQRLDGTIALLARYGIFSLLDMHQDVYSSAFAGEGAPDWAVCTDGASPQPQRNVPDWSVNLQGPGVIEAYTHFWDNDVVGNLQGAFDSVWSRVASHYRSNPWVLGYDPFNEPYGQDLPPRGTGASFDAMLQCFYMGRGDAGLDQAGHPLSCPRDDPSVGLIPRVEAADPTHLVFYEPNYTVDSGPPNHIGPMSAPRLVLNFHDYCFLHVPNGPEPPGFASTCGPLEQFVFTERSAERSRDSTSRQLGGPAWLLTEFGATTDASDVARIVTDADAHLVGWIYWQWLRYDDPTGSHSSGLWPPDPATAPVADALTQTYASAVAGTPEAATSDPSTGSYSLRYRATHAVVEPTVIVVPRRAPGPSGYCARVVGGRIVSSPGAFHLDVVNAPTADTVSVSVAPGHC